MVGYMDSTRWISRSENEGRNPWSQALKEAVLELKGGVPVLLAFARPGGIKFSPEMVVSLLDSLYVRRKAYLHACYTSRIQSRC
jgi:hypothetical protein